MSRKIGAGMDVSLDVNLAARSMNARVLAAAVAAAITGGAAPALAQDNAGAEQLEEIVVTSSIVATPRRQIGTAVSVIDADEIALRGYPTAADMLRTQPGIGVTGSGGHGKNTAVRIRGEEHYRTLLIIDGVKSIDPSATQAAPVFDSLLTTGDLERIEVLRGPQGFMYGADAGGVVNLISARGEGPLTGRVGLEGGRYGTSKIDASLSGGSDDGDYYVSLSRLETDGFNAQFADDVLRDSDGADNTTLHTKLGWQASDALRVQLVARDIDASARFDGCFSMATFSTTHDCVAITDQTTFRLSAEHETAALRNEFAYSQVTTDRSNIADGELSFATEGEIERFEYIGAYSPNAATTLVYGLDLQNEQMASDELRERRQTGYYFEYQGAFANSFYVSAGARHDDNDDFGSHTSVRVSGAYVQDMGAGRTLKYRATYGTGFRAPSLYEISFNAGAFAMPPASEIALREEQSRGYDIGLEYDTDGGLHVELTYFDQRITDEIYYDLIASSGYLQSEGRSESKGVELAASGMLGDHWRIYGNLTYNDAENTANEQRLRRPKQLGNFGVMYSAQQGAMRIAANYRIARDSLDVGGVRLDDYGVLDLSATFDVRERIQLHARLENALDENYQELIGYRTPGRALYAGLRLQW